MTTISHDVKQNDELQKTVHDNRPPNLEHDEVLYADDTILFSTSTEATRPQACKGLI